MQLTCEITLPFTGLHCIRLFYILFFEGADFFGVPSSCIIFRFLQCSFCHLKSGFSHHSKGKVTSDVDHHGWSSPKLSSSVSRSRGKDYRGKKLGHDSEWIFLKAHPLNDVGSESPYENSGSYQEIKLRVALTKWKGSSISRTALVHENLESYSSKPKFNSRSSVSGRCMSSASINASATNSQSTISFESNLPQQQNTLDISSQAV